MCSIQRFFWNYFWIIFGIFFHGYSRISFRIFIGNFFLGLLRKFLPNYFWKFFLKFSTIFFRSFGNSSGDPSAIVFEVTQEILSLVPLKNLYRISSKVSNTLLEFVPEFHRKLSVELFWIFSAKFLPEFLR